MGDLRLIRAKSGTLQLRLSSTLINVGSGPLVVRATRERAKGGFIVEQRVRTLDGRRPYFDLPIGTKYAGDGHSHWHIRDVVRYTLIPLADDEDVRDRRINKIGFCIYDNVRRANRPGQPVRPQYRPGGCGQESSTTLRMGLSVGWGDLYEWTLPGQYLSLTGLPPGDYRLLGEANPEGVFYEQRDDNNVVYVDLRLRREDGRASIRILRRGVRPVSEAETMAVAGDAGNHEGHSEPGDPPGSGVPAPGGVDYASWLSTPAPLTASSRTRSRKAPSRA